MAGDWIKLEHTTPDKPEIYAIAEILGIDPDAVVGKLIRFWSWCDQQSVDGNALSVTSAVLDRITHQPGFSDALRKVAWLEVRSGSLQVPRFDRHNGQTAKARAVSNRRVAEHRKRPRNDESVTSVTPEALQKPLPEKRREEIRESVSAQAPASDFPPEKDPLAIVQVYPRKEGLAEALNIVRRQLDDGEDYEAMLAGTRACAAVIRTLPSGPLNRYVPSAETFFRKMKWKDDPDSFRRQGNTSTGQGQMSLEDARKLLGGRAAALDD